MLCIKRLSGRCWTIALVTAFVLMFTLVSAAAERVVIRYSTWLPEQQQAIERDLIETFEKEHPNIDIEYEYYAPGQYWDKLAAFFAAGNAPDVTTMSWLYEIPKITNGLYVDLLPLMARDGVGVEEYFESMVDHWRNGDGLYGMPTSGSTGALFYNRSLFEEAGLQDPNALFENGAWDWDAMLRAAKLLTRDVNGDGTPEQWGMSNICHTCPDRGYALFPALNGVGLHNADRTKTNMDHPQAIEAYQFMADLSNVHGVNGGDFAAGNQAIVADAGSWRIAVYNDQIGDAFKWDVVPWAQGPHGGEYGGIISSTAIGITNQTEHRDEAWEFVKFMIQASSLAKTMEAGAGISPHRSASQVESVFTNGPPQHAARFLEIAATAHDPWVSGLKDPLAIHQAIGAGLSPLMAGEAPAQTVIPELAKTINAMLQEQKASN